MDFASREIVLIRRNENHSNGVVPGADIQQLSFDEADVLEDELASIVSGRTGRKALAVALTIMDQIDAAIMQYLP